MSRIRGKDTKSEMAVRSMLHAMGARFRLHRRDLPGSPDIVLPRRNLVVFVHGCFWHRHRGCKVAATPKTRRAFWQAKFAANIARDRRVIRRLRAAGWRVAVVWECQLHPSRRPTLQRRLGTVVGASSMKEQRHRFFQRVG